MGIAEAKEADGQFHGLDLFGAPASHQGRSVSLAPSHPQAARFEEPKFNRAAAATLLGSKRPGLKGGGGGRRVTQGNSNGGEKPPLRDKEKVTRGSTSSV